MTPMLPPNPNYDTHDLDEARAQAQIQARIEHKIDTLGTKVDTALKALDRHDDQLRSAEGKFLDLNNKHVLADRDIATAHRRLDSIDSTFKSLENTLKTIERSFPSEQKYDALTLRVKSLEENKPPKDFDEKWKKLTEDGIPAIRFGKWAFGIIGANVIITILGGLYLLIRS